MAIACVSEAKLMTASASEAHIGGTRGFFSILAVAKLASSTRRFSQIWLHTRYERFFNFKNPSYFWLHAKTPVEKSGDFSKKNCWKLATTKTKNTYTHTYFSHFEGEKKANWPNLVQKNAEILIWKKSAGGTQKESCMTVVKRFDHMLQFYQPF